MLKNQCFRIVVLEKTLASPFNSKGIKSINLKGNKLNSHWKSYAKAEAQIFGTLMQRADSLEKTLMLEKIEGRK